MVRFGPGGNSLSFAKKKFPDDLPAYLKSMALQCYEIECGRGVRIAAATYEKLPDIARDNDIVITLHAPYFISLSSENEETRLKSVDYIMESMRAADRLGAKKVVVHSGSCAKMPRETALALAKDTLSRAMAEMKNENIKAILCPETMGKINQLGTLSEVLELCTIDESMLPCVDFGHLNARTLGGIKSVDDYNGMLAEIENKLGFDRLSEMHVHFSKIEYTAGGEKRHLTFADEIYGPAYEPLTELFAKKNLNCTVICESDGTQAEDASLMKKAYDSYL